MDYSKLSTEDLMALKNGDYSAVSTEGLKLLSASQTEKEQPKENKGIDLTPSGIGRTMATATVAPFYAAKTGQKVPVFCSFYKLLR
jgi:hypothetical protein